MTLSSDVTFLSGILIRLPEKHDGFGVEKGSTVHNFFHAKKVTN